MEPELLNYKASFFPRAIYYAGGALNILNSLGIVIDSMSLLDDCFVDNVRNPVLWIEVGRSSAPYDPRQSTFQRTELSTLEAVTKHVDSCRDTEYTYRFMSLRPASDYG
jgi:hypothetical protein